MLSYIGLALMLIWVGLIAYFAKDFLRLWREPVLRDPVLILESDDWGAGPAEQAEALSRLNETLAQFKDATGRSPVTTLGVILATADTRRIREFGGSVYYPLKLSAQQFNSAREIMLQGTRQGIFALHLHGMEHYWPPALMRAAANDSRLQQWLQGDEIQGTESLPSPLQSRWIDASTLPSCPLADEAPGTAIPEEVAEFETCFGERPRVAVATTFIWTEAVENAWAKAGINVIVTPGQRHTARDAAGKPSTPDKLMLNGERSNSGQLYLVRDVYFEPSLGHTPEQFLREAEKCFHLGRPCLVEMHRFNFMGTPQQRDASLRTLESAMEQALKMSPTIRFMSTLELAEAIRTRAPGLIEQHLLLRARIWLRRITQIRGFGRLSRISGLTIPFWLASKIVGT